MSDKIKMALVDKDLNAELLLIEDRGGFYVRLATITVNSLDNVAPVIKFYTELSNILDELGVLIQQLKDDDAEHGGWGEGRAIWDTINTLDERFECLTWEIT